MKDFYDWWESELNTTKVLKIVGAARDETIFKRRGQST